MARSDDWTPERIRRETERYRSLARERPAEVLAPRPGQESVWDYPRPPRVESETRAVRVVLGGIEVATTRRALRVLETSSPPTIYVPPADVRREFFTPTDERTLCEWKGLATYWSAEILGQFFAQVAWTYEDPSASYEVLRDSFAFFPGRVDACWLGDERVRPQPGTYYGGWVTREIVGPFKGVPGSERW